VSIYKCWVPGSLDRDVAVIVAETREQAARECALSLPLGAWAMADAGAEGTHFTLAVATYDHADAGPIVVEIELTSELVAQTWPRGSFASTRLLRGERDKWEDEDEADEQEVVQ
jgi:hypothetical protein